MRHGADVAQQSLPCRIKGVTVARHTTFYVCVGKMQTCQIELTRERQMLYLYLKLPMSAAPQILPRSCLESTYVCFSCRAHFQRPRFFDLAC